MRDASVGFQCPECVKEGASNVRVATTVAGGRISANSGIVTKVLVAINVVAYLAQQGNANVTFRFGGFGGPFRFPYDPASVHGTATGEYYRLITEAFLHVSVLHIAFNMYLLYVLGLQLENSLGRLRFAGVYLISALGGSVLSYLLGQDGIGASGAVFGLFSATYIVARKLRLDTSQITFLIAFNLIFSFVAKGIGYWAHIGGLLTGALVTVILIYVPRGPRRNVIQGASLVVLVGALMALAVARTHSLRTSPGFAQAPSQLGSGTGRSADNPAAASAGSVPRSTSGNTISRSPASISRLR